MLSIPPHWVDDLLEEEAISPLIMIQRLDRISKGIDPLTHIRVAYFWCYGVWVWGLGCGYATTVTYFSETHFQRPIFEKRAMEMGQFRKFH